MIWGLSNPWVILGILAASIAALTGTYFYGVGVGKDKVEAVWQAREAKINADTAVAIQAAGAKTLAAERASAERAAAASTAYQNKLKEKDREKATAIANQRAGNIRLRDPNASTSTCRDPVSPTGPGPGGHPSSPGPRLPVESTGVLSGRTSEFLIGEASRADKVVEQLAACQAIIKSDRSIK